MMSDMSKNSCIICEKELNEVINFPKSKAAVDRRDIGRLVMFIDPPTL